jgi:thiol-disulfide isomerase/thioredoxin
MKFINDFFPGRTAAWFVFCVCVMLTGCTQPPPALKVKVGEKFPDLVVKDLKHHDVTLSFESGKITVLNFWATWCGPCRHEMPSLDHLAGLLDDTKFRVVGVSVDQDTHLVREFLIDRKIYFENYLDGHMINTNKRIGIRAFPSTFLIGGDGRLLKIVEGGRYWDSMETLKAIKSLAEESHRGSTSDQNAIGQQ